jgi:hypothetical protein
LLLVARRRTGRLQTDRLDDQGASDRKSDAKASNSCGETTEPETASSTRPCMWSS